MTVPYERHVIVNIQIRSPRIVIQILHPPANDFQRALVRDAEILPQQAATRGKRFAESWLLRRETIRRNAKQKIWVRREACPNGALRSVGNARKIGAEFEQIEDDLEMNVWHPSAVFICRAHSRKFFSAPNVLAGFHRSKGFFRQVAIQCEEFLSVASFVPQNHERSVVLRFGIISGDVDHAIQWGAQPRPWLDE